MQNVYQTPLDLENGITVANKNPAAEDKSKILSLLDRFFANIKCFRNQVIPSQQSFSDHIIPPVFYKPNENSEFVEIVFPEQKVEYIKDVKDAIANENDNILNNTIYTVTENFWKECKRDEDTQSFSDINSIYYDAEIINVEALVYSSKTTSKIAHKFITAVTSISCIALLSFASIGLTFKFIF